MEGCTGWRYVVEELAAAGVTPHLAEPADTAALRGKKRHAKTDKTDARHLRVHLMAGDLPECWIPPGHLLEVRATARLYKDLLDERGAWYQRIAATLFHQGAPVTGSVCTLEGRAAAAVADLSPAGRQAVETGLRQIDRLTGELDPLRRQLDMISRRVRHLMLSMQALRIRHETRSAKYHRGLKVVFDFIARINPGTRKDWRTARDNAIPALAGTGSELITSDRAAFPRGSDGFGTSDEPPRPRRCRDPPRR